MSDIFADPSIELPPDRRAELQNAALGAVLAVPLIVENRTLGTVAVVDRRGRVFSDQEARLVQAFADQAAVALRNARTLHESRVYQKRLETLLESSQRLGQIQSVESLLSAIAQACGRLLDSPSVGFRLVEGDELVVAGTWGDAKEMMPTPRLKFGESLSGLVAQMGEVLVVPDPSTDPRTLPEHRQRVRDAGYRAFLGVPVKLGERMLGVLSVRSHHDHGFTEEDIALATAFAAHAAIALENARLFQDVRRAYDELSRAQDQLVQAQKMEALGQLAGGIAHDFNNLLTVIIGRAHRLTSRGQRSEDLDIIASTAERAAALTRQLLAFSRRQRLERQVQDLNLTVGGVAAVLRRLIGEDVNLTVNLGAGGIWVDADPTQIEQVLLNLALNARDAMPRGGRLVIETGHAANDAAPPGPDIRAHAGNWAVLSVTDDGVGMDPETLSHIFEPFFTTKGPGKGTGLGLATVHGIVGQHGGHIAVDSAPGRGTTFRVCLPEVAAPVAVEASREAAPRLTRGSEIVLLVEDEEPLRHLVSEILRTAGYQVLEAPDPEAALQLASAPTASIDLLLTDVVMPKMNGPQLAQRITARRPATRVLYMSGYAGDALDRHGLSESPALIYKPFTPDALLRHVRESLDDRQRASR